MVTCSYKWLTYNACVYFMKLSYSSKDSLLHSELICIHFKLTTPTVQEFWPSQEGLHEQDQKLGQNKLELRREIQLQFINVDVTYEVLSV